MKPSRAPFSFLLPLFAFALWVMAVVVPTTIGYVHLVSMAKGEPTLTLTSGSFQWTIQRGNFLRVAAGFPAQPKVGWLAALNLPGLVPEMGVSRLMHTWPEMWQPRGMMIGTWRKIAFPIYCLPFWWFIGIGLDAGRAKRRPLWIVIAAGAIGAAFCLTAVIMFPIVSTPDERGEMFYPICGFALWALLFATGPSAWLAYLLRERRTAETCQAPQALS